VEIEPVLERFDETLGAVGGWEVIPESIIRREPSAELRFNQWDVDSLPGYELLDKILAGYVEEDKSASELVAEDLPIEAVNRVIRLVDRRLPITNCYRTQA